MATHYITLGNTGDWIEADCRDAEGAPDFSTGTLVMEICAVGVVGTNLLTGTPTDRGAVTGSDGLAYRRMRYTFLSNWSWIANRSEILWVKWHHTVSGVTRSYPTDGYDTLYVTANPGGT